MEADALEGQPGSPAWDHFDFWQGNEALVLSQKGSQGAWGLLLLIWFGQYIFNQSLLQLV